MRLKTLFGPRRPIGFSHFRYTRPAVAPFFTVRTFLRSLLLGAALTAAGLFVTLEYCMAGPGYGFPAAVIHPSHDEWWLVHLGSPPAVEGLAFDGVSLAINLAVFSLAAYGVTAAFRRRSRTT